VCTKRKAEYSDKNYSFFFFIHTNKWHYNYQLIIRNNYYMTLRATGYSIIYMKIYFFNVIRSSTFSIKYCGFGKYLCPFESISLFNQWLAYCWIKYWIEQYWMITKLWTFFQLSYRIVIGEDFLLFLCSHNYIFSV
jgi:hypothetical protein